METLIYILAPLLLLLAGWATKKLLNKFNVSLENQIIALSIVKKGIERAETIAIEAGWKGPKKLQAALQEIDKLSEKYPQVRKIVKDQGEKLVERVLRSDLTEVTPKK